jgi:NADH dehydrogenase
VVSYGLNRIDPKKDIQVTVIEAANRILPALNEKMSQATTKLLQDLGVSVLVNSRVSEVSNEGLRLSNDRFIPSKLVVWAAGVKAADYLSQLDGLQTNHLNQLLVHETLQTTVDENIFALGDCAACPWRDSSTGAQEFVPPRAQAAHQQASHMVKQIKRRLSGKSLLNYKYKDFGSLVSLGKFSSVGSMMGGLLGDNLMIQGYFAKLMYLSLYKMHELALHGVVKVSLDSLARMITKRTEPHVKLH